MKITQFDPDYSRSLGTGDSFLVSGPSGGSNAGFGGDVVGDWGNLSVIGLRQRVSLSSNMGDSTVGTVLTTLQTSPWVAAFAVPSNSGSLSFGSNAMAVGATNQAGTTGTYVGSDHRHLGLHTFTSSSSNTFQRPTVNLRAGANIAFGASDSDGDGTFDTLTISATAAAGGSGSIGSLSRTVVYKSANETVTNSTTLQDDDHLLFAVGANELWIANFWLFVRNAANTADIKSAVVGPAGATTVRYGVHGIANNATSVDTTARMQALDSGTAIPTGATASASLGDQPLWISVYVENGANAGNVKLQWAQNTVDATNGTTVLKGSYLIAERVA